MSAICDGKPAEGQPWEDDGLWPSLLCELGAAKEGQNADGDISCEVRVSLVELFSCSAAAKYSSRSGSL